MAAQLYTISMTIALTLLFFMGGYLIFGKIPLRLKGSIYSESRIILGLAYIVLASEITLVAGLNLRHDFSDLATSICMTTYYLLAGLLSLSYTRLLGNRQHFSKQSITINLLCWLTFSSILIGSILIIESAAIHRVILLVAAILYIIGIIYQIALFFRSYKNAVDRSRNYYSENVEEILEWMPISIYNMIAAGILGGILSFGNQIVIIGFTAYGLCTFIYIFVNIVQMMIDMQSITKEDHTENIIEIIAEDNTPIDLENPTADTNIESEQECDIPQSALDETFKTIETKLNIWIDQHRYLENGVSIQSVASEIYTNRTYLSRYINTKYNCSFREWIISLRIEKAQRLMIEHNRLQITEISSKVGFSASSSFTRAFTRHVGIAPAKWREQNGRQTLSDNETI